ncbi:hypothetical protein MUK42_32773 [Musa troglodytarum]|uniref:Uncharacterized protein n=1 Tax=Musa troglodytarum TaxID=320322 RepID=A0A9E7G6N8_9LILI|nr:hypothetical protein MUK42_32773 [Musa troglodytarum]URE05964.1 hypothetical protein MUK42_32773 [Musa troglodytarum]URE05965.1 hypothetical protein MUK42_32773 [Musa troglodytarum]URE05969.1 hypothetical protein MUK42_32773 [Musa troglodytarum]
MFQSIVFKQIMEEAVYPIHRISYDYESGIVVSSIQTGLRHAYILKGRAISYARLTHPPLAICSHGCFNIPEEGGCAGCCPDDDDATYPSFSFLLLISSNSFCAKSGRFAIIDALFLFFFRLPLLLALSSRHRGVLHGLLLEISGGDQHDGYLFHRSRFCSCCTSASASALAPFQAKQEAFSLRKTSSRACTQSFFGRGSGRSCKKEVVCRMGGEMPVSMIGDLLQLELEPETTPRSPLALPVAVTGVGGVFTRINYMGSYMIISS